jgi:RNA polymerase sigma-70 factor, ECF subfamily
MVRRPGQVGAKVTLMAAGERDLLLGARAGDARSIDALLARHEQQIFRFGLRMCGNEDDARDVLQETLLAAFRGLHEFRGEAELSTWLYQIARSFCLKSHRRSAGEPQELVPIEKREARSIPTPEARPDARAQAREMGELLQAAILSMPESQREVIILRDVEGLSAEEAGQVVGIEVGALKSRLHRARAELRERLVAVLGEDSEGTGGTPCPELAAELSGYAAEEIDQAACARIEEHLKRCPRCAGACAALQRTVSLCKQIPGGEVPAPVRAAVRAAVLAATPRKTALPEQK